MNNQQENRQQRQKLARVLYPIEYRLMSVVGIAMSIIFTQAFIGIGITDNLVLYSLVCFSLAIPLLLLHIFIASLMSGLRSNKAVPVSLYFFFSCGGFFCLLGIVLTLFHLSPHAGLLFAITTIISLTIALILIVIVPFEEQQAIEG